MSEHLARLLLVGTLGLVGACGVGLAKGPGRQQSQVSSSATASVSAAPRFVAKTPAKPKPTPSVALPPAPPPYTKVGDLEVRVVGKSPSNLRFDGGLSEWPAGAGNRAVILLEPTRWVVAFELSGAFRSGVRLEVSFPEIAPPQLGYNWQHGFRLALDCSHDARGRYEDSRLKQPLLPAAVQSRCRALVARYEGIKRAFSQQFRRVLELTPEGIRAVDGSESKVLQPTQRGCTQEAEVSRCEFELPLTALPRTARYAPWELLLRAEPAVVGQGRASRPFSGTTVGFRLESAVAFEPGAALRGLLFQEQEEDAGRGSSRQTYQPGEAYLYEALELPDGVGDIHVKRCEAQGSGRQMGPFTLRSICGNEVVLLGSKPIKVRMRGRVTLLSEHLVSLRWESYYDQQYGAERAGWQVEVITPTGKVRHMNLTERSSWEVPRPLHNADYSSLEIRDSGAQATVKASQWVWDPTLGSYRRRGTRELPGDYRDE